MSAEQPRFALARMLEARCKDEYSAVLEIWRDLERKAQGVIALSGVLLAGIFAIASKTDFPVNTSLKLSLYLSVTLLAFAILSSVKVLRGRRVVTPPMSKLLRPIWEEIDKVLDNDNSDARLSTFVGDQFDAWTEAIDAIRKENEKKARDLSQAHIFAIFALFLLWVSTVAVISF